MKKHFLLIGCIQNQEDPKVAAILAHICQKSQKVFFFYKNSSKFIEWIVFVNVLKMDSIL